MFEHIQPLVKLDEKDRIEFDKFIQTTRKNTISPPKETTKKVVQLEENRFKELLNKGEISECIHILRELSYDEFLKEEAIFNGIVLAQIGKIFEMPKLLLQEISQELHTFSSLSKEDFFTKTSYFFGEYAGAISPYIYHLNLSNTQSRRSRAGKTFEGIVYFLYEYFNYSYDAQSTIGKKSFSTLNLGKVVDSILPGKQAFMDCRTKTIVGSMKTTLRERWQEVVEEISRSNLPNIYLLTMDSDISENKAIQMAQHNIILVVPKEVKSNEKLKSKQSIIDFETYFLREIPSVMSYWRDANV